jgi:hypothetical protein
LVDEEKVLISGGLLFAAYEREEMFAWLLESLQEIVDPLPRTIFTDEDSAIVPVMTHFRTTLRPDVAHHICVFHKKVNFMRRVNLTRATAVAREEAANLFDEMCAMRPQGQAIAAIDKIRDLLPGISGYLDAEVVPMLSFFSDVFRGDAFTLGYHAISIAESANHMIKRYLPPHIHDLTEIRDCYTRSHQVKALGTKHRTERQFYREHFLRTLVHAPVSRVACDLIDARVHESRQWHVIRSLRNADEFEATAENENRWIIRTDAPEPRCECNDTSGTGLPCPHIIALYSQFTEQLFPIALIAGRCLPGVPKNHIPCLPILTLEEMDDFRKHIAGDGLEEEEETVGIRAQEGEDPHEREDYGADDHGQSILAADQQRGRYLRLLYLGKQIAQKGADASSR